MREKTHFDLVQTYFDQHAQEWHNYYQGVTNIVDLILIDRKNIAVGFLSERLVPGARILDAGCGAGITAIELALRGFSVLGVDISPNMIEIAQQNLAAHNLPEGRVAFRTGNMLAEPVDDLRFDCVLALGFIQYQKDETASIQKLSDFLNPGGLLVISGPMNVKITNYFGFAPFLRRIKRRLTGNNPQKLDLLNTISANYYSVRRFRALLEGAGLEMLEYSGHGFIHFEYLSSKLSFANQVRLHKFFTSLARILPIQQFANDIVVIARNSRGSAPK